MNAVLYQIEVCNRWGVVEFKREGIDSLSKAMYSLAGVLSSYGESGNFVELVASRKTARNRAAEAGVFAARFVKGEWRWLRPVSGVAR